MPLLPPPPPPDAPAEPTVESEPPAPPPSAITEPKLDWLPLLAALPPKPTPIEILAPGVTV